MNSASQAVRTTVERYREFFETIRPKTLASVAALISRDVRFVDPFNDIRGRDGFIRVFENVFDDVADPAVVMLEEAWGGDVCFLKWRMTCRRRHLGDWQVTGVTELRFDDRGRVRLHRDYWDAGTALYGRLPALREMIGFVRRRLRPACLS
jgi:steroid delta-isomerase